VTSGPDDSTVVVVVSSVSAATVGVDSKPSQTMSIVTRITSIWIIASTVAMALETRVFGIEIYIMH
jgi:hypothetical protein